MEISYAPFLGALKRNCILTEKMFSFHMILGLHGAFRSVTPCINEKALFIVETRILVVGKLLHVWNQDMKRKSVSFR